MMNSLVGLILLLVCVFHGHHVDACSCGGKPSVCDNDYLVYIEVVDVEEITFYEWAYEISILYNYMGNPVEGTRVIYSSGPCALDVDVGSKLVLTGMFPMSRYIEITWCENVVGIVGNLAAADTLVESQESLCSDKKKKSVDEAKRTLDVLFGLDTRQAVDGATRHGPPGSDTHQAVVGEARRGLLGLDKKNDAVIPDIQRNSNRQIKERRNSGWILLGKK